MEGGGGKRGISKLSRGPGRAEGGVEAILVDAKNENCDGWWVGKVEKFWRAWREEE